MACKKVLIIHTGGTIGMKKTDNGYAPVAGFLREALEGIPDLKKAGMPSWELLELPSILDSSNVGVREWNEIAKMIYDSYGDYDGYVILHGTDTMAYTASALSFILENNDKPIILTGSQIPLCELRSDGVDNIVTSLIIAAEGVVREICLFFGSRLLRGNRATKMSADGLRAFDSPNYPHLADVGISIRYNRSAIAKPLGKKIKYNPFSDVPIGVIKVFPGVQFALFEPIMTDKLSGIVLEGFGTGNIPDRKGELLPIVKRAFDAGVVVVVCSQCPQGAVSLGAYETSTPLKRAGAISGSDMTTEAAVAKLYHLRSSNVPDEQIQSFMLRNISGELTENV